MNVSEILNDVVNRLSSLVALCLRDFFHQTVRVEASVSMVRANAKRGGAKVQVSNDGVWQLLISCRDGAEGWNYLVEGILRLKLRAVDGKKVGRIADADRRAVETAMDALFTPAQKAEFIIELGRMILPKGTRSGQLSYTLAVSSGKAAPSGRVYPSDKTSDLLHQWRKAATILGGSLVVLLGEDTVDVSNASDWNAVKAAIKAATRGASRSAPAKSKAA